jgi:hypothetical protein
MLEGIDEKKREHIYDVVMGWVNAHHDAKTGAPDPVFEAIEAHRQALRNIKVAFAPDADDEYAMEDAVEAEQETLLDFLYTEPTTIAGALAALEFASSLAGPDTHDKPVLDAVFESRDPGDNLALGQISKMCRLPRGQPQFPAGLYQDLVAGRSRLEVTRPVCDHVVLDGRVRILRRLDHIDPAVGTKAADEAFQPVRRGARAQLQNSLLDPVDLAQIDRMYGPGRLLTLLPSRPLAVVHRLYRTHESGSA